MNPYRLSKSVIDEAIRKGNYELTGLLETGEITIAIMTDLEKEVLEHIVSTPNDNKEEIIEDFIKSTRNETSELLEVYKQWSVSEKDMDNVCKKNRLRFKF